MVWPQTAVAWSQFLLIFVLFGSAAVAIIQLRKSVKQSRATFLLELETKWDRIEEGRKEFRKMRDVVHVQVIGNHADKKNVEQEKELRGSYASYLTELQDKEPALFALITEYWGFYEMLGLMIRKQYIPFDDAYLLYKGPLIDVDQACSQFIRDWEMKAHVHSGLYENMLRISKRATARYHRETGYESLKRFVRFWE